MLRITPWERSALQLLAKGSNTTALADRLEMTESDTEAALAALFARMCAANLGDALAAAARLGLLSEDQIA